MQHENPKPNDMKYTQIFKNKCLFLDLEYLPIPFKIPTLKLNKTFIKSL